MMPRLGTTSLVSSDVEGCSKDAVAALVAALEETPPPPRLLNTHYLRDATAHSGLAWRNLEQRD